MNELLVEKLKEARNNKGLKQQEVADQLGIKANTISNWEKGRTEPDIDTFVKLCRIYQIDCADLLSDVYAFKRISNDISLVEYEYIKKYRNLDDHGREMVDFTLEKEYERSTLTTHAINDSVIYNFTPSSASMVAESTAKYNSDAAHPRTDIDVPEDTDTSDNDIMNDEDF